ncbi:uncharacterized protein F5891DRAFT_1193895 [Suillus fuscotomentosus]|uniref:Uncharacterized protein n=1 Tax=Suillus fuscotomentosus TaxID=1912939 RepID=A0AAD4HGU4_9AGAM|nr:uncharacterized protein F5891DRAFT_1193895 [Suillus fuscotomentosus]KAG1895721.1 hypothetical protein F5891DRAFT_1193895 [Suillus fuscotomentosus]
MSSRKYWVVFGGISPGIYDKQPFTAYSGSDTHYFPLVIHCQTNTQAEKLFSLHDLVCSVPTEDAIVVARAFMDSDAAQGVLQKERREGTLQGFYGIASASRKDCHQLVSGYCSPMYKKFETFADAVAWMIMKGKCIDGRPIGGKIGLMKEKVVESPVVEVSNLSLDPPKRLLSTVSSILGESSAPHNRPSLATSSNAPVRVYQYMRELSGIQSTLYSPPPADDTPLRSFGDIPDSYLEAHGYSSRALLCIQHALDVSMSGQQFVNNLSSRGLPVAEARWLWLIVTGDNES